MGFSVFQIMKIRTLFIVGRVHVLENVFEQSSVIASNGCEKLRATTKAICCVFEENFVAFFKYLNFLILQICL